MEEVLLRETWNGATWEQPTALNRGDGRPHRRDLIGRRSRTSEPDPYPTRVVESR